MISAAKIRSMAHPWKPSDVMIAALVSADYSKLETGLEMAHWMAQMCHESMGFTALHENLNYSQARLRQIFPKYFSVAQAKAYARKPQAIANRAYANRLGNGSEASGDGWRYRGRGLTHLTGKANYREAGRYLGIDLVKEPDLAADPEIAVRIAIWFWESRGCGNQAIRDNVRGVTRLINGGQNGIAQRIKLTIKAKTMFLTEVQENRMLSLGARGGKVDDFQKTLYDLGYTFIGKADGVFGPLTERAVKTFQRDHGLTETGIIDEPTQVKLDAEIIAKSG